MSVDISNLQFRDIRYLLAVYRLKSFRKAAELCNVSQATVSAQILKVERLFNMRLLNRTTRKVEFSKDAEPIINQLFKIQEEVQNLSNLVFGTTPEKQAGVFNVGIIPTISPFFAAKILEPLRARFPNYVFNLQEMPTEQIIQELEYKTIEFAIAANHPILDNHQKFHIGDDELHFLVNSHSPNCIPNLDTKNIINDKIFLLADGNCLRDNVLDICSRNLPGSSSLMDLAESLKRREAMDNIHGDDKKPKSKTKPSAKLLAAKAEAAAKAAAKAESNSKYAEAADAVKATSADAKASKAKSTKAKADAKVEADKAAEQTTEKAADKKKSKANSTAASTVKASAESESASAHSAHVAQHHHAHGEGASCGCPPTCECGCQDDLYDNSIEAARQLDKSVYSEEYLNEKNAEVFHHKKMTDHDDGVCPSQCPYHDYTADLVDLRYGATTIETLKAIVSNNMGISIIPRTSLYTSVPNNTRILCMKDNPVRKLYVLGNGTNQEVVDEISEVIAEIYEEVYNQLDYGRFEPTKREMDIAQEMRTQILAARENNRPVKEPTFPLIDGVLSVSTEEETRLKMLQEKTEHKHQIGLNRTKNLALLTVENYTQNTKTAQERKPRKKKDDE